VPDQAPSPAHPAPIPWHSAAVLILLVTAARLLYLALLCPYTLIEDEANYWEWSRHLSLSYYTKGPGIAWTIAAFTRVLGESEFAIRAVAAIAGAAAAMAVAGLTYDITRSPRASLVAVGVLFLMPVFQALSLISTIDGPFAACWAVGAWAAWRVANRATPGAVVALSIALGIGLLYKYTMLLFLPGLLWVLWRHRVQAPLRAAWIGVGVVIFLALASPIIIWNHEQGWPTLRHVVGHLGLAGGDQAVRQGSGLGWVYKPQWTLGYIGTQLAIAGPMLILAAAAARRAWRERSADAAAWTRARFLLALSLPIFAVYLGVSLITNPQGNWALAGFITLVPLAALAVPRADATPRVPIWSRPFLWHARNAVVIVGLVTGLGMLRLDLLTRIPGIGPLIPIWRATGADKMAAHTREIADSIRAETGEEPFFMALHYGRAAQLAFYLPGRPTVFCTSSMMLNGRRNPYDDWPSTDLRTIGVGPGAFPLQGRNAVVNGASLEDWQPYFDRVVEVGTLRGDGKKNRPSFRAYGFRGFPQQ
jgi:4-amino-4-deoxy-L-arabinose transferase-like glycosyltransferase